MSYLRLIGIVGISALLLTCEGSSEKQVEFIPDARIMVMSDTHYESEDSPITQRLRDRVSQLNDGVYDVDLLLVTGDNVDKIYGGSIDRGDVDTTDNKLNQLMSIYADLSIPGHLAIGNHDLKIASGRDYDDPWSQEEIIEMTALWKKHTGFEPYYGFTHKGWRFVILNSMGGHYDGKRFEAEQIDFLKAELALDLPTLLFSHHPFTTDHVRSWCKRATDPADPFRDRDLYRLLWSNQDQVKAIFVGHGHMFVDDMLYGKIQVVETEGFERGDELSFNILELDSVNQTVRVIKGPDLPIRH